MIKSDNWVIKSKELLDLKNLKLTLNEYKILDIYLSRINPTNEESARVTFTIDEYCTVMGITSGKVRKAQIKKYVRHLFDNSVIEDLNNGDQRLHNLFDEFEYRSSENRIIIECGRNEFVRKLFFDKENFQYIKYRLKNTVQLNSLYSVKGYLYFIDNKFRGKWEIELDRFKNILECTSSYYDDFKEFNRKILLPMLKDINSNTDIYVECEKIKTGKKVTSLSFQIKTNYNTETDNMNDEKMDIPPHILNINRKPNDFLDYELLYEVGELDYIDGITQDKIRLLYSLSLMVGKVSDKVDAIYLCENIDLDEQYSIIAKYLYEKILEMKCRSGIQNKFAYLKSMIEADVNKGMNSQDSINQTWKPDSEEYTEIDKQRMIKEINKMRKS